MRKMKMKKAISLCALALAFSGSAMANLSLPWTEDKEDYLALNIASDIGIPWGMAQLPSGEMIVTERSGNMYLVPQSGDKIKLAGLPEISAVRQGGLLDVALHPDYANQPWLYFTFSSPEGEGKGSHTALMRAKLNAEKTSLVEHQLLYKGQGNTEKGVHFGSRIAFDDNGFVFFSIGDRGARDVNPQDLSLDGGKIYRLHLDGKIPADNPFVKTKDAKPATFSYGHRNPQGMIKHPETGEIWSHEHGPRGGDELNKIEAGKNYGWPVISYGINYSGTSFTDITEKEGMEQPKLYWDPSIAPSGMAYITSDKYPQWQGKILLGSMKFAHLVVVEMDGEKPVSQSKVLEGIGRVRNVYQGLDGYIYLGIDGQGIKRLEPKS